MCMAIQDTIIERHICTSEWAVSNFLPSKGSRDSNPSGSSPFLQGGGTVWADMLRYELLLRKWQ
jgi:hypothetical protein